MTVYVATRYCRELTLTLGVFSNPGAAREYAETMVADAAADWREPGPGRRYWELHSGVFTYTIEEHYVR